MEDTNNNEDCSFVPDCLLTELLFSKDLFPMDEQSVPAIDQISPEAMDQIAASFWQGDPLETNRHQSHPYPEHANYEGAPNDALIPHHDQTPSTTSLFNNNNIINVNVNGSSFLPSTSVGALPLQMAPPPEESTSSLSPSSSEPSATSAAPSSPPLCCPVCYRTFRHKLGLTNHQRVHTAKHPHLCSICGETFKYKTNFKRHRRVHAKEMKICRYCGINMESDYDLVQHEKEHRRQQKQL